MVKDCSLENWALEGIDILFMMIVRNSMWSVCYLLMKFLLVRTLSHVKKLLKLILYIFFFCLLQSFWKKGINSSVGQYIVFQSDFF